MLLGQASGSGGGGGARASRWDDALAHISTAAELGDREAAEVLPEFLANAQRAAARAATARAATARGDGQPSGGGGGADGGVDRGGAGDGCANDPTCSAMSGRCFRHVDEDDDWRGRRASEVCFTLEPCVGFGFLDVHAADGAEDDDGSTAAFDGGVIADTRIIDTAGADAE